jgi:hypothetical protein
MKKRVLPYLVDNGKKIRFQPAQDKELIRIASIPNFHNLGTTLNAKRLTPNAHCKMYLRLALSIKRSAAFY